MSRRNTASSSTTATANTSRRRRDPQQTYVTFQLEREVYALPITRVREIIGVCDCTPLPRMPAFVRGVINLRGRVLVVIDTRRRLAQSARADDKRTCIIIVTTSDDDHADLMGLVVDRMSEVAHLPPECLEPADQHGTQTTNSCIQALAKCSDQLTIILSIDHLTHVRHAKHCAELQASEQASQP